MDESEDLTVELQRKKAEAEQLRAAVLANAAKHVAKYDRIIGDAETALEAIFAKRHNALVANSSTNAELNSRRMTIKDMALEVLAFLDQGADTQTILHHINQRFKSNISRESLSPQLSRLRVMGKVELHGRTWFLPDEADHVRDFMKQLTAPDQLPDPSEGGDADA